MFREIFNFLKNYQDEVCLVGGFLRDTLLKNNYKLPIGFPYKSENQGYDIDLIVKGNVRDFLEDFRRFFGKKYIPLKENTDEYRIIISRDNWIDVSGMKGTNIEKDLSMRDYTINSMAVCFDNLRNLIDPYKGLEDLKKKLIRTLSKNNLEDDPLRILRGFRFVSKLCFDIEKETEKWIIQLRERLERVAAERIHYEIFQIFSGKCLPEALDKLVETEVLFTLFPELSALKDTWQVYHGEQNLLEHTILAVKKLHFLMENLENIDWLSPYSHYFREYIESPQWRALILLGALFHDIAKPSTLTKDEEGRTHFYGHDKVGSTIVEKIAERFKFSNFEKDSLVQFVRAHMHPHLISRDSDRTRRAVNRFMRKYGDLSFPLILFAFADAMASLPQEGMYEGHKKLLKMMVDLIEEKEKRQERLITGHDLIALGLEPSPLFKKILDEIDDLSAEGIIKSREDALKYVEEKWLVKGGQK